MRHLNRLDELDFECGIYDLLEKCKVKTDQDFEDFYEYVTQLVELTIAEYQEDINV